MSIVRRQLRWRSFQQRHKLVKNTVRLGVFPELKPCEGEGRDGGGKKKGFRRSRFFYSRREVVCACDISAAIMSSSVATASSPELSVSVHFVYDPFDARQMPNPAFTDSGMIIAKYRG